MASGSRLPLVQADLNGTREWLSPAELQEAFRLQPRFVMPDLASLRLTVLIVIVPGGLFLRWLYVMAIPAEAFAAPKISWSRAVTCAVWAASALVGLVAAACRNPGVVPRAPCRADEAKGAGGPRRGEAIPSVPPRYVTLSGVRLKQRWCSTCRVYRPPRTKHCSWCDRCIFRFDHHCTWLGNCIGLGNYRSFLFLMTATALFFGHSAVIALQVLLRDMQEGSADALVSGRFSVFRRLFVVNAGKTIYIVYATVLFLAFFVLLLYHVAIIAQNLTTNEHVRDYYVQDYATRNPFDMGCLVNYQQVICVPYGFDATAGPRPEAFEDSEISSPRRGSPASAADDGRNALHKMSWNAHDVV